jgi:hypothetical protein
MMRRLVVIGGLAGLQSLSCGGDTPPCANNNCTLPGNTIVKFTFDAYPEWQFPMDSCSDFGATKVQVDVADGAGSAATTVVDCGEAQATFMGLDPGDYTVSVTPLDIDGNALVSAPATGSATSMGPGTNTTSSVNVTWDQWTGTHTGTFLFRVSWGGKSCAMATPPVVSQVLTLKVQGQPVTATTEQNLQKLDGTGSAACYPLESSFPDDAKNVPFGPAQLTIVGMDGSGSVQFEHTFDTFVGAGISNPTITYDVPAPDAGVDAGVDAGIDAPPDAPPDA